MTIPVIEDTGGVLQVLYIEMDTLLLQNGNRFIKMLYLFFRIANAFLADVIGRRKVGKNPGKIQI